MKVGSGSVTVHVTADGRTKYRARLSVDKRRASLGLYESEEQAWRIVDASIELLTGGLRHPRDPAVTAPLRAMKPIDGTGLGGVYFAFSGGLVKIGYAKSVTARMRELATGCPRGLRLLAVVPGPPELERDFHRRFAARRRTGEWFSPDSCMVSLIVAARPTV